MKTEKIKFNAIDEYISSFPKEIQPTLTELKKIISSAAPKAEEKISYNMPTYFLNGNLVHFAGYKITLVFIHHQGALKILKKILKVTKPQKEQFNSLLINLCLIS